jgi:hypothetical protein
MTINEIIDTLERLRLIEQERMLTPVELVTKGRCLQLAPVEAEGATSRMPKVFFQDALGLDPEYVPALLELAYLYYAVWGGYLGWSYSYGASL